MARQTVASKQSDKMGSALLLPSSRFRTRCRRARRSVQKTASSKPHAADDQGMQRRLRNVADDRWILRATMKKEEKQKRLWAQAPPPACS